MLPDGRFGFAGGYVRSNVSNFTGSDQWTLLSPDVRGVVTAPEAPTGPVAAVAGRSSVSVQWTDASASESGFRIERRESPDGAWVAAGTASRDATTFTDDGLARGVDYEWHVCAYNSAGDSQWTSPVAAETPAGRVVAPAALSFGTVKQGRTRTLQLTVRNTDRHDALWVEVGSLSGDFACGLESGVLVAPGKRIRIPVQFNPGARGTRRGVLTLETSAAVKGTWNVKLKGVGRR
jgi:hypothetical protein